MPDEHLNSLLVDQDRIDTERLAAALRGRVGVDGTSGTLVTANAGFRDLRVEQKVLAVLLGGLAATLLEKRANEQLTLKEIINVSGLPRGSAAPAVRKLMTERRLVDQAANKAYFVLRSRVLDALEELER